MSAPTSDPVTVHVTLNGEARQADAEPRRTLADFVREDLGATGTHLGCEHGVCGACTVLVDDAPVRSCLMLAVQADGASIRTIEGLGDGDELGPLQRAMRASHSFQCGFCTPGFLMQVTALLEENPTPTEPEVREVLSGNLCRCTGYESILDGIAAAVADGGSAR